MASQRRNGRWNGLMGEATVTGRELGTGQAEPNTTENPRRLASQAHIAGMDLTAWIHFSASIWGTAGPVKAYVTGREAGSRSQLLFGGAEPLHRSK